jgi:hypothetical protein
MSEYHVLTTKQQAILADKLTKANALMAEVHAAILGNVPQVVPKKPRKARTPKAAEPTTPPAVKRRGRPPKQPEEVSVEV